eukprot:gene1038-1569_t
MEVAIKHTPEHCETTLGEAVIARDEAVATLTARGGIGPPDLCWLRKGPRGVSEDEDTDDLATGGYHWVLGLDTSSQASIAAYFASLESGLENRTFLRSFFRGNKNVRVEGGLYCCYDAFSRLDIRCELTVPGGVTAYASDGEGENYEVDEQMWKGALVSAFLRNVRIPPSVLLRTGCVRRLDQLVSMQTEKTILATVLELYAEGVATTVAPLLQTITQEGIIYNAPGSDVLLDTVLLHFESRQRQAQVVDPAEGRQKEGGSPERAAGGDLQQAVEFFRTVAEYQFEAVVPLVQALRNLRLFDDALQALEAALKVNARSVPVLTALAETFMDMKEYQAAIGAARDAVSFNVKGARAWMVLVRAYLAVGQTPLALIALNMMPPPPAKESDEAELIHVILPPAPGAQTQPNEVLLDPDLEVELKCVEETTLEGKVDLGDLPGASLVASQQQVPARQNAFVWSRTIAYGLLVDIIDQLSWDKFLQLRSELFIMDADVAYSDDDVDPGDASGEYTGEEDEEDYESGEYDDDEEEEEEEEEEAEQGKQDAPAVKPAAKPPLPASPILTAVEESPVSKPASTAGPVSEAKTSSTPMSLRQQHAVAAQPGPVCEVKHGSMSLRELHAALKAGGGASVVSAQERHASQQMSAVHVGACEAGVGGAGAVCESASSAGSLQDMHRALKGKAPEAGPGAAPEEMDGSSSEPAGYEGDREGGALSEAERPGDAADPAALTEDSVTGTKAGREPGAGGAGLQKQVPQEALDVSSSDDAEGAGEAKSTEGAGPPPPQREQQQQPALPPGTSPALARKMQIYNAVVNLGQLPTHKGICAVWLDEIIQAIYEDLAVYMDWRYSEWKVKRRQKRLMKGLDEDDEDDEDEMDDEDYDSDEDPGQVVTPGPPLTAGDWLKRGLLSERLLHLEDAERAYRAGVNEEYNMTCFMGLLRVYSVWGWPSEALMSCAQILTHMDLVQDFAVHKRVPELMLSHLHTLVSNCGLQDVRSAQDALGPPHKAVNEFLHDVVKWKGEGWDR